MKPTALRIGNIVTHEDYTSETFEVTEIRKEEKVYVVVTKGGKNGTWDNNVDLVNPIPLTEEWLQKFNYIRHEHGEGRRYSYLNGLWSHNDHEIYFSIEDGAFVNIVGYSHYRETLTKHKIEFVHQFQNFHYELADKELQISQP